MSDACEVLENLVLDPVPDPERSLPHASAENISLLFVADSADMVR
jgi:hypothetical protein